MARVSKKVSAAQREAENTPHRIWKTAIYARLSDFDDVLRDTESLEVQISYIKEYINHRDDLMLLDVFADKRCTGMNFDRPEFERLLKALQERKVNCIVVKDFSRLGRNFVETGQYLEQVFPLFGVRFIAINPARTGTQSVDLLFRTGTAGRKAECRKDRDCKTTCCTV